MRTYHVATKLEVVCARCGETFLTRPHGKSGFEKFCSVKCSSLHSRNRISIVCAFCGKPVEKTVGRVSKARNGLLFCDRECKENAQRADSALIVLPHYQGGISVYRDRAFRKYGKTCMRCGYDEISTMLDVDHIDGDHNHTALENLQVLCVWCHTLKTRRIPSRGFDADWRAVPLQSQISTRL